MSEEHIVSEKITHGTHTYFFDVKKSKRDEWYLRITERRYDSSEIPDQRIFIFEDAMNQFIDTFVDVLEKIYSNPINTSKPAKVSGKSSNDSVKNTNVSAEQVKKLPFEKIRQFHENAYRPWTKEDDEKLEKLFCSKKSVQELSKIFGRRVGAIHSRIVKLDLEKK